jgi:hypothetical protein
MRYRSKDGCWTVTPISLSLTGTGRDGDWLRVSYPGMFVAEVRTLAELAEYRVRRPAGPARSLIHAGAPCAWEKPDSDAAAGYARLKCEP